MGIIAREGVAFGTGYAAEFYGDTISNMSMEERMTLCNMAIEGGAKMEMCSLIRPHLTMWPDVNMRQNRLIRRLNTGNSLRLTMKLHLIK